MSTQINIENIGGITKPTKLTLKEGMNVIRAPNAVGKTSFIRAIQTMILPEDELKKRTEFLNDFATRGKVEMVMKNKTVYRTLRLGAEGLSVVGDALYKNGWKANLLSVAVPENDFLDNILKGKNLHDFFENFSETKNYKKLLEWCENRHYNLQRDLYRYTDDVTRLKNIRKQIEKYTKELENLGKERMKLKPIVENIKRGRVDKKLEEVSKKREKKNILYSRISELNYQIDIRKKDMPKLEKEIDRLDKEISEFHKTHPNVEKEIDKLWDKIIELRKVMDKAKDEVNEREVDISACEQGEGNRCRECGRPFTTEQRRKRQSDLRKQLTERRKELVSVESKIKETEIERDALIEERDRTLKYMSKELNEKSGTLTQYERDSKAWEKERNEKISEMNNVEKEITELEKALDPRTRGILQKAGEVESRVGETEGRLKGYNMEVEELSESQKIADQLQIKTEFLKSTIAYLTNRINELKDVVRKRFNERIKDVYEILGFKDFEKIEIDDMFQLTVRRKCGDRTRTQEINRLSTSERITIGVIVMLAGKEEYLPDFPFFVLDEVTTAYDPKRFEKIIDYLHHHVPYVVVTALAPTGEALHIEHKL
ncbi:MAG: hypothetical protein KKA79_01870 [Nanoarchaeota archaeon]|nr:hypothetical protein [Nanoarchaeota archaeon]MCG2717671.1 hypothetical protein [Nanoarchaeota archaeon]